MTAKMVFLDRDGVLVRNVVRDGRYLAPRQLAEFSLYHNAGAAVAELRAAGWQVAVVTNQPDLGNGLMDWSTLDRMHQMLTAQIGITGIFICPHRQEEGCACRKPAPGLLLQAAAALGLEIADLVDCWMVGDRASDIVAGQAVGCRTIMIDHGTGDSAGGCPDLVVDSLSAAIEAILSTGDTRGAL